MSVHSRPVEVAALPDDPTSWVEPASPGSDEPDGAGRPGSRDGPTGRRSRARWLLPVLALILLGSVVVAMGLGTYPIAPERVSQVLWAGITGGTVPAQVPVREISTVWDLRLPRTLGAVAVGAILAAAGAALQAVVRNSLADPYLVGVSAGASLGAALVITLGLGALVGAITLAAGAFAGASLAVLLVLSLSRSALGGMDGVRLVLAGIAVTYFLGALTNLVVVLADSRDALRSVLFWTLGSLGRVSQEQFPVLAMGTVACVGLLTVWARRLDAVSLGDDVARSLGTNPERLRRRVVLVSSFGVAVAVAVSGSIGFVGLVVPHLARRLVGATHRVVVPASALLGALLLLWADVLARTVLSPREIPLGILTALVGTPVLMLLLRRQRERGRSRRPSVLRRSRAPLPDPSPSPIHPRRHL